MLPDWSSVKTTTRYGHVTPLLNKTTLASCCRKHWFKLAAFIPVFWWHSTTFSLLSPIFVPTLQMSSICLSENADYTNLKGAGAWFSQCQAPVVRNWMPQSIRLSSSLLSFKSQFKTHLFFTEFPWYLWYLLKLSLKLISSSLHFSDIYDIF